MKNGRIKLVRDIEILPTCDSELLTGNKIDSKASVTNHFLSSKFFPIVQIVTLIAMLIT